MTQTERNHEIYAKYCAGARHKAQGVEYNLAEKTIKLIVAGVRKELGVKKQIGKRQ